MDEDDWSYIVGVVITMLIALLVGRIAYSKNRDATLWTVGGFLFWPLALAWVLFAKKWDAPPAPSSDPQPALTITRPEPMSISLLVFMCALIAAGVFLGLILAFGDVGSSS